jgi:hypothetical protein
MTHCKTISVIGPKCGSRGSYVSCPKREWASSVHSAVARNTLEAVQCLLESLGVSSVEEQGTNGEPSNNCQSLEYFYLHQVIWHIQAFEQKLNDMNSKNDDNGYDSDDNTVDVSSFFSFQRLF